MTKIYIIFPYLNTFKKFEVENIEFKGWFEGGKKLVNNLSREEKNDKYHLEKILGSFRVGTNHKLQGFTYSIQTVETQEQYEELKNTTGGCY
jgi:hypothetical protein